MVRLTDKRRMTTEGHCIALHCSIYCTKARTVPLGRQYGRDERKVQEPEGELLEGTVLHDLYHCFVCAENPPRGDCRQGETKHKLKRRKWKQGKEERKKEGKKKKNGKQN